MVYESRFCRKILTPILRCIGGAADIAVTAEISSKSGPAAMTAIRVNLFESVFLTHPTSAAQIVKCESSTANSEKITPTAVSNQALTHGLFEY